MLLMFLDVVVTMAMMMKPHQKVITIKSSYDAFLYDFDLSTKRFFHFSCCCFVELLKLNRQEQQSRDIANLKVMNFSTVCATEIHNINLNVTVSDSRQERQHYCMHTHTHTHSFIHSQEASASSTSKTNILS